MPMYLMRRPAKSSEEAQADGGSGGASSLRVLVGTVEIAGQLPDVADGFRRLGHEVTSVVSQRNPFYPELRYDVDAGGKEILWSYKADRCAQVARLLWLEARHQLIARHDVFVFFWAGKSLLEFNSEYPLLKKLGKRIVTVFNGDDVRHWSAYSQQQACVVKESACVALQDLSEAYRDDPLERPLQNIRMAERWSDLIISQPNQSVLAVRPYMHFFVPLDLSGYRYHAPGREVPVVVHAPSHKGVKGTETILAALDRLKAEGVPYELRLLHGVSSRQVISELVEADVVIDQLHLPLHGKLGVEAMASGCALATCDREGFEPFPPARPVWHIGPENLGERLRRLLTDRELRLRLARDGRRHVERYHDHVEVARRMAEHLEAGGTERYDHYPTFFAREYRLPEGAEVPARLRRMTSQIVRQWGLPEGAEPQDLVARGLMSAEGWSSAEPIPRWKPISPAETLTT
jgi:glycosyltransferase involved in cell wall biosynthesis